MIPWKELPRAHHPRFLSFPPAPSVPVKLRVRENFQFGLGCKVTGAYCEKLRPTCFGFSGSRPLIPLYRRYVKRNSNNFLCFLWPKRPWSSRLPLYSWFNVNSLRPKCEDAGCRHLRARSSLQADGLGDWPSQQSEQVERTTQMPSSYFAAV